MLAWKPSPTATNVARSYQSYSIYPVALACVKNKQPEKVIALCRHGIGLDNTMSGSGFMNVEVFELLMKILIEAKRPDEARDVLVSCFLPPKAGTGQASAGGGSASSTPQLGFQSAASRRFQNYLNWMWNVSWDIAFRTPLPRRGEDVDTIPPETAFIEPFIRARWRGRACSLAKWIDAPPARRGVASAAGLVAVDVSTIRRPP